MRALLPSKKDLDRGVMRVELDGNDVELLEATADRLDVLLKIEKAMDSVAVQSPSILGKDTEHVTREGVALIRTIVRAWDEAG